MLQFDHVAKTFRAASGPVTALDAVSFEAGQGELLAISGPSGCGKSTLLLAAGALLRPDAGSITINGQAPYALSPERRSTFRAKRVGFVFQQFHLVPYLTVRNNILAPTLAARLEDASARVDTLLRQFQLQDRAEHMPAQLSTGERQRTALARALLHRPALILADEPTGNLDAANADRVLDALRDYAVNGGCALLVTHDPRAVEHATRTLHMDRGRVRH